MEDTIHEIIENLIGKMGCTINKFRFEKDPEGGYNVNLETSNPNLMIGHHGENIGALQHIAKLILWNKLGPDTSEERPDLSLDIDNYRKRQEENVINLAERKVEMVRKLASPQSLPAMAPYFRRVVHLHLAQEKFKDIRTESEGQGEYRYIVIKPEIVI
jgi:spoIIIJ-associated protein